MASTSTAPASPFRIFELLEQILCEIESPLVLVRLLGVSRFWRDIITGSPALRRRIFLEAITRRRPAATVSPYPTRQMQRRTYLDSSRHPQWYAGNKQAPTLIINPLIKYFCKQHNVIYGTSVAFTRAAVVSRADDVFKTLQKMRTTLKFSGNIDDMSYKFRRPLCWDGDTRFDQMLISNPPFKTAYVYAGCSPRVRVALLNEDGVRLRDVMAAMRVAANHIPEPWSSQMKRCGLKYQITLEDKLYKIEQVDKMARMEKLYGSLETKTRNHVY